MLDKLYHPQDCDPKIYDAWEKTGVFECHPESDAQPYTIMFPPPNVTGHLHMGHALTFTLQDILIRYHRMKGRDTLWQPGSDHAGIATQMVVERNLAREGVSRHEIGRTAFLDRIWQWKSESGGTIQAQLRRLGASAAWSRDRFTMDEGLSRAVRKVFVTLYNDGLIYRDKRLVNWDPTLQTAISDLEVEQKEVIGKMWYFRYPLVEDPERSVVIATTRPETMLGDTAVAVHPEDERYTSLIGLNIQLPLCNRQIPIIADTYVDPQKGSGVVKITPAHDFNDFEVGQRHNLPIINIFDRNAVLNEVVPEVYRGLDRFTARDRIVADMDTAGLLEKIEENPMVQPYGDRSGTVIEPWLTDQWYVKASALATPAREAVRKGQTKFVPEVWEKTYFDWLENIQPWCVSRQLWWGHQIPAWYGPDGTVFVAESEDEALLQAAEHYGSSVPLEQDEDVLDTWFSSALWPFSTLGWPEKTPDLSRYYQTDVLVTGFDIIFFWVARMMMMGLYCTGQVPFHTVYIHALVRDEKGQKMSKSKGNVIDPLVLIDQYGTDAVRFTLASMAAQGRDIKLSVGRVEGYRNFATKFWNAARFCQMNGPVSGFDPESVHVPLARWIVGETQDIVKNVTLALDTYRFNDAAHALYQFIWGTFCDWFIEFTKPVLTNAPPKDADEIRAVMSWTLDQCLRLLHPFMPHLTEHLWQNLTDTRQNALIIEPWPQASCYMPDYSDIKEDMAWVIRTISAIRSARTELNIPPSIRLPLLLEENDYMDRRIQEYGDFIRHLSRLDTFQRIPSCTPPAGCVQIILDGVTAFLPVSEVIDISAEKQRLGRMAEKLSKQMNGLHQRLSNPAFTNKAPEDVVQGVSQQLEDITEKYQQVTLAVEQLEAALKKGTES